MNEPPVPFPPPNDNDLSNRINKLAEYVAKNGIAFESKVKEKEQGNPNFAFLQDCSTNEYYYYKWKLFCFQNKFSIQKILDLENQYIEKLSRLEPGTLDLTQNDENDLLDILQNISGSKEKIKSARKWILERPHSLKKICILLNSMPSRIKDNLNPFESVLHILYILNDILHNLHGVTTKGRYTLIASSHSPLNSIELLFPTVQYLSSCCIDFSRNQSQKERLKRLILIWDEKMFFDSEKIKNLKSIIIDQDQKSKIEFPILNEVFVKPFPDILTQIEKKDSLPQNKLIQIQQIQKKIESTLKNETHTPTLVMENTMPKPTGLQFDDSHSLNVTSQTIPTFPVFNPIFQSPLFQQIDLTKIPVGNLVNVVKAAKASGVPDYYPIDLNMLPSIPSIHVEPARIEVRINEFYNKLRKLKSPEEEKDNSSKDRLKDKDKDRDRDEFRDKNRARDRSRESSRERYRFHKDKRHLDDDHEDQFIGRRRKYSLTSNDYSQKSEEEISQDNMGHKILTGLGWQTGSGLGSSESGIIEPIKRDKAKIGNDKTGVGAESDSKNILKTSTGEIDFTAYRKQLSSEYHSKINERERDRF